MNVCRRNDKLRIFRNNTEEAPERAFFVMREQENERPLFATLRYDILKKLKITPAQYMLLDMVYHLSAKDGYCYKSTMAMAQDLDMTQRGIQKMIAVLIERELLSRVDKGLVCSPSYTSTAYIEKIRNSEQSSSKAKNRRTKFVNTRTKFATDEQSTSKNNNIEIHKELDTNVSKAETPKQYGKAEINELFEYWEKTMGYPILSRKTENRRACQSVLVTCKNNVNVVKQFIDGAAMANTERFAPQIADFEQLRDKLNNLYNWGKKKGLTNAVAQF